MVRYFHCKVVNEEYVDKTVEQQLRLTGDELVEYLNNPDRKVLKAEKVEADREKIKEVMKSHLQEAYREILKEHHLQSGDISPLEQHDMDKKEEALIDSTEEWIQGRLQ